MLQKVLNASLGHFQRAGFTLDVLDGHAVALKHDGVQEYVFSNHVTIPVIHECCRLHLEEHHLG
jgi:hypothetical protein